MLFRKKKSNKAIFRSIYEENLRIVGRQPTSAAWKMPVFLKWHFLFLYVLIMGVFLNADYLDSTFSFERPNDDASITGGEKFVPAEYLSLIDKKEEMPLKQMFGLGVRTIVIDPGHGGEDPGTVGGKTGLKEKDIALDIAIRLKERLLKSGKYNVLLTREADETVPLTKRIEFANTSRADLFVSVHVNYLPSKPINMIETYYFGPSPDAETLRLAAKENADSHYQLSEFKELIEKIGNTLKLQESRKFASFIQDSLYRNIKSQNRSVLNYGIKRAPFMVLLGIEMPGVLTEVSCLSNRAEELRLHTERYRDEIAEYIESGILNYLKKGEQVYEARRGSGQ